MNLSHSNHKPKSYNRNKKKNQKTKKKQRKRNPNITLQEIIKPQRKGLKEEERTIKPTRKQVTKWH